MGTKERRDREREEIRTRILDTARELFVSEGYEAVTMRKIADRIEYSPTAIYFHFKDKEALLKEICQLDFYSLARELSTIPAGLDPIEKLRAIGLGYIRFGLEYPNHYRLMFMTPHPPVTQEDDDLVQHGNPESDAYASLRLILSEAVAKGRIRPEMADVELLSQTMWGGVHGVISLQIAKCNDDWIEWKPLELRAKTMIDTLIDGITRGKD